MSYRPPMPEESPKTSTGMYLGCAALALAAVMMAYSLIDYGTNATALLEWLGQQGADEAAAAHCEAAAAAQVPGLRLTETRFHSPRPSRVREFKLGKGATLVDADATAAGRSYRVLCAADRHKAGVISVYER